LGAFGPLGRQHEELNQRQIAARQAVDRSAFRVRGIQVDGGAEFKSVFERECRRAGRSLRCCASSPRSLEATRIANLERCKKESDDM
jgi:hypothetical protein